MNSATIQILQSQFDTSSLQTPGEDEFQKIIKQAIESCEITGYDPNNHFRDVTKNG